MGEEWRDITGYEGSYQVSSLGRVKSLAWPGHHKNDKILKPFGNGSGYCVVCLYDREARKKVKKFLVHRLVAEAFLANPDNKTEVNHKSGVKNDNSISNLEWATKSENMMHASYVLGVGRRKQKVACVETGEEFESIREAGRKNGVSYANIRLAANGEYSQANGRHWEFVN